MQQLLRIEGSNQASCWSYGFVLRHCAVKPAHDAILLHQPLQWSRVGDEGTVVVGARGVCNEALAVGKPAHHRRKVGAIALRCRRRLRRAMRHNVRLDRTGALRRVLKNRPLHASNLRVVDHRRSVAIIPAGRRSVGGIDPEALCGHRIPSTPVHDAKAARVAPQLHRHRRDLGHAVAAQRGAVRAVAAGHSEAARVVQLQVERRGDELRHARVWAVDLEVIDVAWSVVQLRLLEGLAEADAVLDGLRIRRARALQLHVLRRGHAVDVHPLVL